MSPTPDFESDTAKPKKRLRLSILILPNLENDSDSKKKFQGCWIHVDSSFLIRRLVQD